MASQGPNNPASATNDSAAGTTAWSDPTNVFSSDDSRATVSLTSAVGQESQFLHFTNFGFSIPSGATINGIVVEMEAQGSNSYDTYVNIIKGGSRGSTNKGSVHAYTGTDTYYTYGGSSDLWGTTWADSDINASNFGASLRVLKLNAITAADAAIDHVRITVYYTEAASGQPAIKRMGGVKFNAGPFGQCQGMRGW